MDTVVKIDAPDFNVIFNDVFKRLVAVVSVGEIGSHTDIDEWYCGVLNRSRNTIKNLSDFIRMEREW